MLDPRFENTECFVEATWFEQVTLWRENQSLSPPLKWFQFNLGLVVQVGTLADLPVNISFAWVKINGHHVAFWEPISRVVDIEQIDQWFKDNCSHAIRTNAANFHVAREVCKK